MKKLMTVLFLALTPFYAFAQATPTPTVTPAVGGERAGDAKKALFIPLVTMLPTVVPTAYSTPQVINSNKRFTKLCYTNDLDCDVVISYGGGHDHELVRLKDSRCDAFKREDRYHNENVYIRKNGTCSSGALYIDGEY